MCLDKLAAIRRAMNEGLTFGLIGRIFDVPIQIFYALHCLTSGLTEEQIAARISKITDGMKSHEIVEIMSKD